MYAPRLPGRRRVMFRQTYTTLVSMAIAATTAAAQGIPTPHASPAALTLREAVSQALERNAELVALRRAYDAARAAPAQEAYLAPPMFETQIWGWPITTLNPIRTEMFMFMAEQELPGRGKRAARELVAMREAAIDEQRIALRANEILDELRQAYVDVATGRAMTDLVGQQTAILRSTADAAALRYASGQGSQRETVNAVIELARLESERVMWDGRTREAETRLNALMG